MSASTIAEQDSTAAVVMLDGTNYAEWKPNMESFLQSKGLGRTLKSDFKKLLKSDDLKLETKLELQDKDERALGHIKCKCGPSFKELLLPAKSAREAWKMLKEYFEGRETFNKLHLLEKLMEERLKESGNLILNVQDYIRDKKQIVRRLESVGVKLPDEILILVLLTRLPSSFQFMRRILEADANITVDKVCQELMHEATRISSSGSKRPITEIQEAANVTQHDSKKPKKNNQPKKKSNCEYCGTPGHLAENCWLNPESNNYRPEFAAKLKNKLQATESKNVSH